MQSEARRTKRIGVSIPAGVFFKERPSERVEAEIINISEGGAFVHCTAPIRIGQEILLEIHFGETKLLQGKVIKLEGEEWKAPKMAQEKTIVRWVRGTSTSGFGVEFTDNQTDRKAFVEKLLNYFESLKKAGVIFEEEEGT